VFDCLIVKGVKAMKKMMSQLYVNIGKLDGQKVQFILLIVCLGLFVIGAGAPDAPGGPGL
jgi:hypothetical protein